MTAVCQYSSNGIKVPLKFGVGIVVWYLVLILFKGWELLSIAGG